MNGDQPCGLCWERPPAVGLTDFSDPLARSLGQAPVPIPLCAKCLGRSMTARSSREFAVQALPGFEEPSLMLLDHDPDRGVRCAACEDTEQALYRLSGDPWDGLPPQLCRECLGSVIATRLCQLGAGTYSVAIHLSPVQPPEPEQSTFWRTLLGAYELEERVETGDARYVGAIYCPHTDCGKTLARLGELGQELVVVGRAPSIDGMSGVPDSASIGYTGYARFGPNQTTNVATVLACWGGHDGLVIDYELCRELVSVAKQRKRRRARLPALRAPSSPDAG